MSEQTTDQTPDNGPQIDGEPQTQAPEVETPGSHPNSEAAKYRVRARKAETALAEAQARIETLLALILRGLQERVSRWPEISGSTATTSIRI